MMYPTKLDADYILSNLLSDHTQIPKEIRNMNYHQLSLFDDYHMQEPLPTQQKGGL